MNQKYEDDEKSKREKERVERKEEGETEITKCIERAICTK